MEGIRISLTAPMAGRRRQDVFSCVERKRREMPSKKKGEKLRHNNRTLFLLHPGLENVLI